MMHNFIIINIHWPMHWLGEVLLHDEICKWIEALLLARDMVHRQMGTQNAVFFVMMEQFQTLQQAIVRLVETKPRETPGPHLRYAVKGTALTGCPAPSPSPHGTYPQHDACPQAPLEQHCSPAQLFFSTQVGLRDPNQQLLAKNSSFSPLLKEGSQVNRYHEMCYIHTQHSVLP